MPTTHSIWSRTPSVGGEGVEDIGRRLREAREARGLTLEAVEEETKIRRKYIDAMESGREADLPGEAYLKGFLRTYGNYLGLDGAALVEVYKSSKVPVAAHGHGHGPGPASSAAAAKTVAAAAHGVAPAEAGGHSGDRKAPMNRPAARRQAAVGATLRGWAVVVLIILAAGALVYFGWRVLTQRVEPESKPPVTPPTQTATPQTQEPVQPPPKLPDPPKMTVTKGSGMDYLVSVPAKEIIVKVEPSTDPVWMDGYVADSRVYMGTGTQAREFTGTKIRVHLGHFDGVTITVNGQKMDRPPEKGPFMLHFSAQP